MPSPERGVQAQTGICAIFSVYDHVELQLALLLLCPLREIKSNIGTHTDNLDNWVTVRSGIPDDQSHPNCACRAQKFRSHGL